MNARNNDLERIATEYHLNDEVPDKFIEDLCQQHCCDWLESLIGPQDRVIELGVGDGVTLSRLSPRTPHYCVVEGAESLVAHARSAHPEVELVHAMFEDHLPAQPCDKLLALHVLEHVDEPVALARHLHRWLRPGGELIIVVPNRNSFHRRLAVLMGLQPALDTLGPRDHLVGHQRVYDLPLLREHLRAAGFEPFEERGFFLKTLPNSMMLGHSPELIKALNLLGDQLPADYQANLALRCRVTS
ncbi:MAG: class I SAM-dependent methyltransferase [Rhizobacter sp.]|nr:class I SAM-dependent methyltransferase [Rhizobacter sp.]